MFFPSTPFQSYKNNHHLIPFRLVTHFEVPFTKSICHQNVILHLNLRSPCLVHPRSVKEIIFLCIFGKRKKKIVFLLLKNKFTFAIAFFSLFSAAHLHSACDLFVPFFLHAHQTIISEYDCVFMGNIHYIV